MEKIKVLIADDVQVIAESNKKIAQAFENIEVLGIAKNGQEEYNMIEKLMPDLVITDNKMPVMNGIEVIEKIKNSSISKKPKFILVTADLGSEFVNNAYSLGVLNVVGKMSSENALRYAIEEFLYLQNTNKIIQLYSNTKIVKKSPKKRRTRIDFKPFLKLRHIVCCLQNTANMEILGI